MAWLQNEKVGFMISSLNDSLAAPQPDSFLSTFWPNKFDYLYFSLYNKCFFRLNVTLSFRWLQLRKYTTSSLLWQCLTHSFYILTFIRRTGKAKSFEMVLRLNFSEGCGSSHVEINIPVDFKVRNWNASIYICRLVCNGFDIPA